MLPAPLCRQWGRQGCQAEACPWVRGVSSVRRGRQASAAAMTHPSGFALVLHRFFGVGHSPLHVVH